MNAAHMAALHAIARQRLHAVLMRVEPLRGGYSGGAVYRVRVEREGVEQEIAIKLTRVQGPEAPTDEALEGRIYAARSWSVRPVYALLRRRGIPTFDLLGSDFPTEEIPFFWIAMSLLAGEPIGMLFGHSTGAAQERLYRVAGETLGAVHAITRDYDGWVDQAAPYRTSWTDAFFRTLDRSLDSALGRWSSSGRSALPAHEAQIRAFTERHRRQWTPPERFVLSHMDGLQAMAVEDDGGYRVTGHVDLEDFAFLDARLPLAGFELSLGIRQRRRLPPAFWEGYRAHAAQDRGYAQALDVYRLYYLLEWSWIALDPRQHATAAEQEANISRFEHAILTLVS